MGRCSIIEQNKCVLDKEQPYRIDVVKDEIRRIASTSLASSKIGLVEFGNWRASGLPKDPSNMEKCTAVKPLVMPTEGSRDQVLDALQSIKVNDDGATPINYAINYVINSILRKQNLLPAKIFLITDGSPNCKEVFQFDLCDLVAGLSARGVELKIDIVGYKADGKDSDFIECANKYPNMVDYLGSANTPQELAEKVDKAVPPVVQQPKQPNQGAGGGGGSGRDGGDGGGGGVIIGDPPEPDHWYAPSGPQAALYSLPSAYY